MRWAYGAVVVLLLWGAWVMAYDLQRESLWFDEGWTWWAIHNPERPEAGTRAQLRYLLEDFARVWDNVRRDDVHPPLYYLGLNAWALAAGESVFVLRVYSLLWGVLALAAAIALGRAMLGWQVGLAAGTLLVSLGVFVYYAREARMYAQWLALSLLMLWACWRWLLRPTLWRGVLWGAFAVLAFWTHLMTALFVPLLWSAALATSGGRNRRVLLFVPVLVTLVGASAWLPFAGAQLAQRIGAADPLPSDMATVSALLHQLSSSTLVWSVALLACAAALAQPRTRQAASLLLAFGLVPVGVLLAANTQTPVFQLRYVLPLWGVWAMLVSLGLTVLLRRAVWLVAAVLLLTIVQLQSFIWLPKPPYAPLAQEVAALRHDLEPALIALLDSHPLRYHARDTGMLGGITVDMSWQPLSPLERRALVERLRHVPRLWLVTQAQDPALWDVVGALGRGVGELRRVQDVLVLRLDAEKSPPEHTFGDVARYTGRLDMVTRLRVGEAWCAGEALHVGDVAGDWRVSAQLTEFFAAVVAQHDVPLGEAACVTATRAGAFHVRLVVYDGATGARLSVLPLGVDFLVAGVLLVE